MDKEEYGQVQKQMLSQLEVLKQMRSELKSQTVSQKYVVGLLAVLVAAEMVRASGWI